MLKKSWTGLDPVGHCRTHKGRKEVPGCRAMILMAMAKKTTEQLWDLSGFVQSDCSFVQTLFIFISSILLNDCSFFKPCVSNLGWLSHLANMFKWLQTTNQKRWQQVDVNQICLMVYYMFCRNVGIIESFAVSEVGAKCPEMPNSKQWKLSLFWNVKPPANLHGLRLMNCHDLKPSQNPLVPRSSWTSVSQVFWVQFTTNLHPTSTQHPQKYMSKLSPAGPKKILKTRPPRPLRSPQERHGGMRFLTFL